VFFYDRKLYGDQARYFEWEVKPVLKHKKRGTLSMVNNGNNMHGSQVGNFVCLYEKLSVPHF
jgi:cyclophilin family peptidyl-prolyl cis-trans isomerase